MITDDDLLQSPTIRARLAQGITKVASAPAPEAGALSLPVLVVQLGQKLAAAALRERRIRDGLVSYKAAQGG